MDRRYPSGFFHVPLRLLRVQTGQMIELWGRIEQAQEGATYPILAQKSTARPQEPTYTSLRIAWKKSTLRTGMMTRTSILRIPSRAKNQNRLLNTRLRRNRSTMMMMTTTISQSRKFLLLRLFRTLESSGSARGKTWIRIDPNQCNNFPKRNTPTWRVERSTYTLRKRCTRSFPSCRNRLSYLNYLLFKTRSNRWMLFPKTLARTSNSFSKRLEISLTALLSTLPPCNK